MTSHYKSNLRDLYFNLFEALGVGERSLGRGPFAELDESTAREMLLAFERLCTGELASSFVPSDRNPPTLDAHGNVTLPAALKRSLGHYYTGGWHRLEQPASAGGMGAPPTLRWAMFELLVGAHAGMAFYTLGTLVSQAIERLGTESQRRRFVAAIADRCWGGTMVMTEADAGSDVGAARASARHVHGDEWAIEGVKRFITAGEHDGAENIVHLVLARPEEAGPGTKGLSLFIVPKIWVEEDGTLGERNGVRCTRLDEKMGLRSSVTCELVFGEGKPARGLLVGGVHDGIRQMFHIIEHARLLVGVKSTATLSSAYLNALAYARQRVQGSDLQQMADKSAPRVTILQHPDVRRMLMLQKCHAEGMRALCLYTASLLDQIELAGGREAEAARDLEARKDLLLPLAKGYCSEKVNQLLSLSLQCLGGSGYMKEYPIEQYIRDQKIDSLYEGTTHIQALDLYFRKLMRDGGRTIGALLAEIAQTSREAGNAALEFEHRCLAEAVSEVQGLLGDAQRKAKESIYHLGLQGNGILFALSELVIGWLLVQHAAVAHARLAGASADDRAFYLGKIASARFYCREVLPGLRLARERVRGSSLEIMELSADSF